MNETEKTTNNQHTLMEIIGLPAMLEQCAEECVELAKATLKLARKIRDDNPTPLSYETIVQNVEEEIADVRLCIKSLTEGLTIDEADILRIEEYKKARWHERLDYKRG